MPQKELLAELSSAKTALLRSIEAIVQASDRYCETFPQSVKDGIPSYADAKSNASATYYMYATEITYVLKSAEGIIALLAPISERASKEEIAEISQQCSEIVSAYEAFSAEALSPYFEASQRLILSGEATISLTPLYRATRELQQRSEEFLATLS